MAENKLRVMRAPRDDEELWELVYAMWGFKIPRERVCPGHSAPFEAFADTYFARNVVGVVKACVPGDVVVYTDDGIVPVSQLRIGSRAWGWKNNKPTLGTVSKVWESGDDAVVTIRTRRGVLRCNAAHRILVHRRIPTITQYRGRGRPHDYDWVDVFVTPSEIRPNEDYLIQPSGFSHEGGLSILPSGRRATIGFIGFFGLMMGDGNINDKSIYVSHHAQAGYMPYYRQVVEDEFGKPIKYQASSRTSYLHSTTIAREFRQLGFHGKAHTKRLPAWLYRLNREQQIAFLRGYLDADGTVRRGEAVYYSCSPTLLEDVRFLALQAGVRIGSVHTLSMAGQCVLNGRTFNRGDISTLVCTEPEKIGSHDPKYDFSTPWRKVPRHQHAQARYCRVLEVSAGKIAVPMYDVTVDETDTFCADSFITHNSRGFGGKSNLASILTLTHIVTLGIEAAVLGGSQEQSNRVISQMGQAWNQPYAPREMLKTEPGKRVIELTNGGKATAQAASSTSVRGAHPVLLIGDECDEMDQDILDSALGQPMSQKGVTARTILLSTHHYSTGVMSDLLKRCGEKDGYKLYEWCYKENLEPHGWLPQTEVDRKRKELPAHIFAVEIELQEPAVEGRAFQTDKIETMFSLVLDQNGKQWGPFRGAEGEVIEIEKPNPNLRYVHGLDLARKQDYTVMVTMRIDVTPFRIVAFCRYRRRGWDEIAAKVDEVMSKWAGYCLFDSTGIGDPVSHTFKESGYEGYDMNGRAKQELLNDYVAGVERDEIIGPRIDSMYTEHKFCRVDDLLRTGEGFHLPDTVQAGALAYRAAILSVGGDIRVVNIGNTARSRTDYSEMM